MKFTIRDVLWLTALVALAVGWSIERHRRTVEHAKVTSRLSGALDASNSRLAEAEDLLEFEGVVFGDGTTIHTTPEQAAFLRKERAAGRPWIKR